MNDQSVVWDAPLVRSCKVVWQFPDPHKPTLHCSALKVSPWLADQWSHLLPKLSVVCLFSLQALRSALAAEVEELRAGAAAAEAALEEAGRQRHARGAAEQQAAEAREAAHRLAAELEQTRVSERASAAAQWWCSFPLSCTGWPSPSHVSD